MGLRNSPGGQKENAAVRRPKALQLRIRGLSYARIAEELGVSMSTAHNDVKRALEQHAKLEAKYAKDLLALEVQRLDDLQDRLYKDIFRGAEGKGEPVEPHELGALTNAALRLSEQRSKLLQLYAPQELLLGGIAGMEPVAVDVSSNGVGAMAELVATLMDAGVIPSELAGEDDYEIEAEGGLGEAAGQESGASGTAGGAAETPANQVHTTHPDS